MRAISRFVLLTLILVVGFLFVREYRATRPWGYGTGYYAGQSGERGTSGAKSGTVPRSRLIEVASNPDKYAGQRVTMTGRVRQPAKYASNRNIYTLVAPDNKTRVLVIDDRPVPQEFYTRTVTGTVKRIPATEYLYLVSVKGNPRVDLPTRSEIEKFFTSNYEAARTVVRDELSR